MRFKRVLNAVSLLGLSIFLTLMSVFKPNLGFAGTVSCVQALSARSSPEPEHLNLLSEFLREDPGFDLGERFFRYRAYVLEPEIIAKAYTSEHGHQKINNLVWEKAFANPQAPQVGKLIHFLAGGRHPLRISFAGATFSKLDFARIKKSEIYQPGYFFSTSLMERKASRFLEIHGKHHSPETHVKIFFKVKGRSGRDMSIVSEYPEAEILYPPDTQFKVGAIEFAGKHERFNLFLVELEEQVAEPPRLKSHPVFDAKRDFLRLQPRDIFEAERRQGKPATPDNYPSTTLEAFQKATEFVYKVAHEKELSVDLLRQIHRLALENDNFPGYFRRRIRRDFLAGQMSREAAIEKLLSSAEKSREVANSLLGVFRQEKVDNFVLTGLQIDSKGHRYFSEDDLWRLSMNPYFQIEQESLRPYATEGSSFWEANVLFRPVDKIESEVTAAIQKSKAELEAAESDYEYVKAVLKLQQVLISIHPFQDGNGRAIKLLSDFLYLKRGIALPLHPNELDYTLSLNELYDQTVREMQAYVEVTEKTDSAHKPESAVISPR